MTYYRPYPLAFSGCCHNFYSSHLLSFTPIPSHQLATCCWLHRKLIMCNEHLILDSVYLWYHCWAFNLLILIVLSERCTVLKIANLSDIISSYLKQFLYVHNSLFCKSDQPFQVVFPFSFKRSHGIDITELEYCQNFFFMAKTQHSFFISLSLLLL